MLLFCIYILFNQLLIAYSKEATITTQPRNKRDNTIKSIIDEPKCGEVKTLCNNLSENSDLLILECLLSIKPDRLGALNEACQQVIWDHTDQIISDENVKERLLPTCRNDLSRITCSEGNNSYFKCIVTNRSLIQNPDCNSMVSRLENVAFTDHRWISDFLQHCKEEIQSLSCGRIDTHSFSQLKTVACLQNNILGLKDTCKREVFRLSELQSDNIKLDAQLYLDCADDHYRYCSGIAAGSGRVFSCLMHQMQQDPGKIATKCRQQLLRREKLIAQDYRVSKGLMRSCREDIRRTRCKKQTSSDKTVKLAQILLCLEGTKRNGTKLESDCEREMLDHRRMLMEDYKISPEIVDNCKAEISNYCNGFASGGKTLHCLMDKARSHGENSVSKVQDVCLRALEDLIGETEAGENWSVDPVLYQACGAIAETACKAVTGGDSRVMSCLMDNLGAEVMTDECETALLQVQYFVARDFKLDPKLYKACKKDAEQHCHLNENELKDGPVFSRQILPCLYRHAYLPEEDKKLEKICLQQIRRVMRQRAVSVDLQPEIEENCLADLGLYCRDKVKKGEEMRCLQDHLEDLEDKCHDVVESFTEIEAQHVDLNPYISKYCANIIDKLCNSEAKSDEGEVMDCLIDNKNHVLVKANQACRASIEHFQIVSLKNYQFTYKFKAACKQHAKKLCGSAKTKMDVVACLSEQMLTATVNKEKSRIPKECRQQLKAQIYHQRENIDYDPALKAACADDVKKFCSDVSSGNSQVLECLQSVTQGSLRAECEKEVFKMQKMEIYDNSVDYALLTMCAETIDQFCPHHEKESVLDCLKINIDKKGFNKKCKMIVMHRMVEQNTNYQLNPSLQEHCDADIAKFCKVSKTSLISQTKDKHNDIVIKCLKNQFKKSRLSESCEKEMAEILREQALDVYLNPLIRLVCQNELGTICKLEDEDSGKAEECLKEALIAKRIATPDCMQEVANMIQESQVDIQADPLLQRACALELLTHCSNVPQGNGRHIQCLKVIMVKDQSILSLNCRKKLKDRFDMYKNLAQALPEGLGDLYIQVTASPNKNYLTVMMLLFIFGIFVVGFMFGGVSKRKYTLLKNK